MSTLISLSELLAVFFFFNDTATTEIYTLSLHDALPIYPTTIAAARSRLLPAGTAQGHARPARSEEHTSELHSPCNLVCRLLLEKKKLRPRTPPPHALRRRQRPVPGTQPAVPARRRASTA